MNMKQLKYFLAVAEELNFTRAAEKVNIAQPPLSQQIIALEVELGTQLFIRGNRTVTLTEAGHILVNHAQRVLNAAAGAVSAVRAAERGAKAKLSVGAIYSALYAFLPEALRTFRTIEPTTEVTLQEMTISQQIAALKKDVIEIGVMRGNIYDHEIVSEQLFRERLILAVSNNSPLRDLDSINVEALSRLPLISVARTSTRGYADRVMNIFEQEDLQPNTVTEVLDMHTSICLVAADMGVAIVPAIMQLVAPHGVSYVAIDSIAAYITFSLAWRRQTITSSMSGFLDAARESAHTLMSQHPLLFMKLPHEPVTEQIPQLAM